MAGLVDQCAEGGLRLACSATRRCSQHQGAEVPTVMVVLDLEMDSMAPVVSEG